MEQRCDDHRVHEISKAHRRAQQHTPMNSKMYDAYDVSLTYAYTHAQIHAQLVENTKHASTHSHTHTFNDTKDTELT